MSQKSLLVILTNLEDFTADYFIAYLEGRGRRYLRLNSESVASHPIAFSIDPPTAPLRGPGLRIGSVDLSPMRSVWYRRLMWPHPPADVYSAVRRFVAGETAHVLAGAIEALSPLWVNHPEATSRAELKLNQLAVAQELGAIVPRTLVTNDPTRASEFVRSLGSVVCKPLHRGLVRVDDGNYAIHTGRLSQDDEDSWLDTVRHCPTMLQEEVSRGLDYRITIIGREEFVAAVRMREGLVDWRVADAGATFEPSVAPRSVLDLCHAMVERMGLRFGAFDFIRSEGGQWVFLEVNPTGEWAWLERAAGFPMRQALEGLLYGAEAQ